MGTGSFPGVKSGRGVTLTPHPLLVPWSRKIRAIPLFPLLAVRPVQSFSACTRVHFKFYLYLPYRYKKFQVVASPECTEWGNPALSFSKDSNRKHLEYTSGPRFPEAISWVGRLSNLRYPEHDAGVTTPQSRRSLKYLSQPLLLVHSVQVTVYIVLYTIRSEHGISASWCRLEQTAELWWRDTWQSAHTAFYGSLICSCLLAAVFKWWSQTITLHKGSDYSQKGISQSDIPGHCKIEQHVPIRTESLFFFLIIQIWCSIYLLLLLLLSSSSSSSSSYPLCRVFILIFLRQTMSLGNTVLQLFCCYYSWCLYR